MKYNLADLKVALDYAREQKDLLYFADRKVQTEGYCKAAQVFNNLYHVYMKQVEEYIKKIMEENPW